MYQPTSVILLFLSCFSCITAIPPHFEKSKIFEGLHNQDTLDCVDTLKSEPKTDYGVRIRNSVTKGIRPSIHETFNSHHKRGVETSLNYGDYHKLCARNYTVYCTHVPLD